MTVRELANDFLDLNAVVGAILVVAVVGISAFLRGFVGVFFDPDVRIHRRRRRALRRVR